MFVIKFCKVCHVRFESKRMDAEFHSDACRMKFKRTQNKPNIPQAEADIPNISEKPTEEMPVTRISVTQDPCDHGFAMCPDHNIDPCWCGCVVKPSNEDLPLWRQKGFKSKSSALQKIDKKK